MIINHRQSAGKMTIDGILVHVRFEPTTTYRHPAKSIEPMYEIHSFKLNMCEIETFFKLNMYVIETFFKLNWYEIVTFFKLNMYEIEIFLQTEYQLDRNGPSN